MRIFYSEKSGSDFFNDGKFSKLPTEPRYFLKHIF